MTRAVGKLVSSLMLSASRLNSSMTLKVRNLRPDGLWQRRSVERATLSFAMLCIAK